MVYRILVGSYTNRISTLFFDPQAKTLSVASWVETGQNPSWIVQHPTDKTLIFATNEIPDGKIQVFKLAEDGSLAFTEECSSGGADPASLIVSESSAIAGNYTSGSVLVIPLSPTSPHLLPPTQPLITFAGSGSNPDRQASSHPHQIILHPNREELLVPDLGVDKVWRLLKNNGGAWEVKGSVSVEAGSGPRHAVFHNAVLYTALELTNKVTSHLLAPLPEAPLPLSTLSSVSPTSKAFPTMTLGEIILSPSTPSHPSPLLYVSNRDEPLPTGDTIAVYTPYHVSTLPTSRSVSPGAPKRASVDMGGQFRYIGSVATGLKHVRAIALGGPDRRFLIAGGVQGGGIKVFERVGASLREIASTNDVEKPTAFLWV